MKFGKIEMNNAKTGETQIQKVMNGLDVIWENWKTVTGVSFLPVTLNNGYTKTITSSTSGFEFKNPTFAVSGVQKDGDDYAIECRIMIEAYATEQQEWITLTEQYFGDIPAHGSKDFNMTYTDTSEVKYNAWRVTKKNGSNAATINGKITAYTYKGSD